MLKQQKHDQLSIWLEKLEQIGFVERLEIAQVKKVLSYLGVTKKFFLITVTGTNGKGSTCHLLEKILLKSGYKVGLFTSPHLFIYNERIRINGDICTDQQIVDALNQVDLVAQKLNLTLGYFSYTFIAACLIYSYTELDFLILEVGCGGRLDPSNAFDADMLAITSIGLDHKDLLGDTREKIALEKSALAREAKPVIIGERDFPVIALDYLDDIKAQIYTYDVLILENKYQSSAPIFLHDNNLKVVLKIVETLKAFNFKISNDSVFLSLLTFSLPGRCQVLKIKGKTVIFDVGHNEQCFSYLTDWLKNQYPKSNVTILYSAFANKSVDDILKASNDYFVKWMLTSLLSVDNRAMPLEKLTNYFKGKPYITYEQPEIAFEAILAEKNDCNMVYVVSGSFVLVSYLLKYCIEQGYSE
ncbi:MAG: hypothetical protein EP298_01630 [Gammaproteobacteria bacterium]|nr:MAG: hypothetical protein EP298_01630 [Gammaproteobacteria bacterium]UTW43905.1 hypothetical protein KFE69_07400 [bacterium SCSIO 12844]